MLPLDFGRPRLAVVRPRHEPLPLRTPLYHHRTVPFCRRRPTAETVHRHARTATRLRLRLGLRRRRRLRNSDELEERPRVTMQA